MSLTMTDCMWTSNLYLHAFTYTVHLTLWVNSRNHTRLIERYDDYTISMNSRYLTVTIKQAQSGLILPMPLPLASLPTLTQEISGFFIVESHVLETTGSFRSLRDVEELWEGIAVALTTAIENALRREMEAENYLKVKENLLTFIMTLGVGARLWCLDCRIKLLVLRPLHTRPLPCNRS